MPVDAAFFVAACVDSPVDEIRGFVIRALPDDRLDDSNFLYEMAEPLEEQFGTHDGMRSDPIEPDFVIGYQVQLFELNDLGALMSAWQANFVRLVGAENVSNIVTIMCDEEDPSLIPNEVIHAKIAQALG